MRASHGIEMGPMKIPWGPVLEERSDHATVIALTLDVGLAQYTKSQAGLVDAKVIALTLHTPSEYTSQTSELQHSN